LIAIERKGYSMGIPLRRDDVVKSMRSDRSPEQREIERHQFVRGQIRISLEFLNRKPDIERKLPENGMLKLGDWYDSNHFRIDLFLCDGDLYADCCRYNTMPDDFCGLVIKTGTQELIIDRKGSSLTNHSSAVLKGWDGNRGPFTFELRDLE
jgi:hypothetical protein